VQPARDRDHVALLARGCGFAQAVEANDLVELGLLADVAGVLVDEGLPSLSFTRSVATITLVTAALEPWVSGSRATRPVKVTIFMRASCVSGSLPAGDIDRRRARADFTGAPAQGSRVRKLARVAASAATRAQRTGLRSGFVASQVSLKRRGMLPDTGRPKQIDRATGLARSSSRGASADTIVRRPRSERSTSA
jgi:hypothetical protein